PSGRQGMSLGRPSEPLYRRKQRVCDRRSSKSYAHDCGAFVARGGCHSKRASEGSVISRTRRKFHDCLANWRGLAMKLAVLVLAWTCVLTGQALPWGQEGHSIIAESGRYERAE